MKRFSYIILVLLMVFTAYAAIKHDRARQQTNGASNATPIKIGAIFSLTDFGAHWGQSERNAAVMAVDEINEGGGVGAINGKGGRLLEMIIEDNESDLKKTVTAAQKLINIDKVPSITGPQWQEFAIVAAPVFETSKTIMITPSGSSPDLSRAGDYIFSTWPLPVNMVRSLVNYIMENASTDTHDKSDKYSEFAVIQVENAFFEMFAKSFIEEIEAVGGKVVANYHVMPEDKDFRTILTRLKAQGVKNIFASLLEGTQAPFYRQARELGLDASFYAPYTIESDEDLMNNTGIAEGVVYPQIASTGSEEFITKYKNRFNDEPCEAAAMSYDNVFILANAINECGNTGQDVKKCLVDLDNYQGASGKIEFDKNGDLRSPGEYVIRTIRNGKIIDIAKR